MYSSFPLHYQQQLPLDQNNNNNGDDGDNDADNDDGMLRVVAPCDMEAGYTFMARTESGDDVPVTVPPGGVREGQIFRSPSPSSILTTVGGTSSFTNLKESSALLKQVELSNNNNKRTPWKDDLLLGCCRYGPFHPALWNAICCPQLLAAQVMTRLHLDWRARAVVVASEANDNNNDWKNSTTSTTFRIVLCLVCVFWAVTLLTAPPVEENAVEGQQQRSFLSTTIYNCVTVSFGLYTWIILTRLRRRIRQQYHISTFKYCHERYEDCCISFWCGCCSVAQMARQTANYQDEKASCCSPTGLAVERQQQQDGENYSMLYGASSPVLPLYGTAETLAV